MDESKSAPPTEKSSNKDRCGRSRRSDSPSAQKIHRWWPPGDALMRRLWRDNRHQEKAGLWLRILPRAVHIHFVTDHHCWENRSLTMSTRAHDCLPLHTTLSSWWLLCRTTQVGVGVWSPRALHGLVIAASLGVCEQHGLGPHGIRNRPPMCHRNHQVLITSLQSLKHSCYTHRHITHLNLEAGEQTPLETLPAKPPS